ncbi:MAG: AsmA family protein [Alphaproteobacteria bacterium]|nr:AsmA family protein [Alphaproteobacteria bacterium]
MKRRVLKTTGIVLAVLAVLVVGLYLSLNIIVRQAIQRVVPKITGTPVSVENVDISLIRGHIGLNGLKIGNPEGFQTPHFLTLGSVRADVNPLALLCGEIAVRRLVLDGAVMSVELNPRGMNNIAVLQRQVKSGVAGDKEAAAAPDAAAKTPAPAGRKIVVDELKLLGTEMVLGMGGHVTSVSIPDITLSQVGGDGGVTLAQLVERVLDVLSVDAVQEMGRAMQRRLMQDLNQNMSQGLRHLGVTF